MNTYNELVKTLFDEEVIKKAFELMNIDRRNEGFKNAFPIEKYDICIHIYYFSIKIHDFSIKLHYFPIKIQ